MTVTLTSPVLGKAVGETYTGALEPWLLAEGYAKQDAYEGIGVSNTGATAVDPDEDPTNPANREDPYFPSTEDRNVTIANDADNLTGTSFPNPGFDFDEAGVDDDAPSDVTLDPVEGSDAGGTVVTLTAPNNNLEGVTAVNFGATPGTSLDTTEAADGKLTVTTPAGTAGAVDVTLVDADGDLVLTDAFTYTA